MATVNRYTKTVDNVYKPRSLQELMIAPAYKRQKHDELESSIAQYDTALAQADALDVHGDALNAEQKKLYDKMTSQRDKLQSEGFSQSSKSDFMRFNKEFQQAIGPQGTIGKIQSAKKSYEDQKKMLIDLSVKAGHDPQASLKQLDSQYDDYVNSYNETKEVQDFVATLPPKYQDLAKDIQYEKQLLGHTVKTSKGKEGYEIDVDKKTGLFVIKTQSGQVITKDNKDAIGESLKKLNAKWIEEGGEGYQSAQWNMMDMENVADYITSSLNSMKIEEVKDTRDTNYQFMKPPTPKENGQETGNPQKDFYTNSGQTLPIGGNAREIRENAEQVLGNRSADGKSTAKAREYRKVVNQLEETLLANSPEYQAAQKEIDAAHNDPRINQVQNPELQEILRTAEDLYAEGGVFGIGASAQGFDYTLPDGTTDNISTTDGEYNPEDLQLAIDIISDYNFNRAKRLQDNLINEGLASQGFERTDITIPFEKTSQNSVRILNSVKSLNDDSIIPGQVTYVGADGESKALDIDEDSKGKVMNLFQNADANDIQHIKLSAVAGEAGYLVRFRPKEGSSLNPNSRIWNEKDFTGVESVEMFLPITKLADPLTGAKHTSTMILDNTDIPRELREEFRKLITTTDISSTTSIDELGESNVSAAGYFGEVNPDWTLDVLDKEDGTYVPYIVDTKGTKQPLGWASFIPNTLDATREEIPLEEVEAIRALASTNLLGIAKESARINQPEIYERFNLGGTEPDTYEFLTYLMNSNSNVSLTNPKDIYFFSKFKNYGKR